MSEFIFLSVELNLVHHGIYSSLVVFGTVDLCLSQDPVAGAKILKHNFKKRQLGNSSYTIIWNPVWKSSHTDSDALQDAVACELVHDQRRLHVPRLLVGVGHEAADKVRLTAVEGGHQLPQGHQVDRGHGLPAPRLLLLLAVLLGNSCGLPWVI